MSEEDKILDALAKSEAMRFLFADRCYINLANYAVPDTRPAWKRKLSEARRRMAYRVGDSLRALADWMER